MNKAKLKQLITRELVLRGVVFQVPVEIADEMEKAEREQIAEDWAHNRVD